MRQRRNEGESPLVLMGNVTMRVRPDLPEKLEVLIIGYI